jgi:RHS repeat-associated protein
VFTDRLGSVVDVADTSGTVLDHVEYTSFGAVASQTGATYGGSIFFTGEYEDLNSQIAWAKERQLLTTAMVWLQRDPDGFAAGDANLDRYVGNDPVNGTDPTGLAVAGIGAPAVSAPAANELEILNVPIKDVYDYLNVDARNAFKELLDRQLHRIYDDVKDQVFVASTRKVVNKIQGGALLYLRFKQKGADQSFYQVINRTETYYDNQGVAVQSLNSSDKTFVERFKAKDGVSIAPDQHSIIDKWLLPPGDADKAVKFVCVIKATVGSVTKANPGEIKDYEKLDIRPQDIPWDFPPPKNYEIRFEVKLDGSWSLKAPGIDKTGQVDP